MTSPPMSEQLPTPPDTALNMVTPTPSNAVLSPPNTMTAHTTPIMAHTSPIPMSAHTNMSPPQRPAPPHAGPTFSVPPSTHPAVAQRPLPGPDSIGDWFSPPPPLISPFSFSNNMSNSFFNDGMAAMSGNYADMTGAGLGLQNLAVNSMAPPPPDFNWARQGSLTQSQQVELMNVLETEGMTDIDAFLSGTAMPNTRWY